MLQNFSLGIPMEPVRQSNAREQTFCSWQTRTQDTIAMNSCSIGATTQLLGAEYQQAVVWPGRCWSWRHESLEDSISRTAAPSHWSYVSWAAVPSHWSSVSWPALQLLAPLLSSLSPAFMTKNLNILKTMSKRLLVIHGQYSEELIYNFASSNVEWRNK